MMMNDAKEEKEEGRNICGWFSDPISIPYIHYIHQADLHGWKDVLSRLDLALSNALSTAPDIILVGNKTSIYGPRLDQEVAHVLATGGTSELPPSSSYTSCVEVIGWVLRFTTLLLRNAINKHAYPSAGVSH